MGGGKIVDAEDVGSREDGGGVGGYRGVQAGLAGGVAPGISFGGEEAFAGETDEERTAEGVEVGQMGEERVVLLTALAEAEAGVEDDGAGGDAGGSDGGEAGGEVVANEGGDGLWGECGKGGPLLRGAAGVHEDESGRGAGGGEGGGHAGIPKKAGDVVDEVSAEGEGGLRGGGMVGVDGEQGARTGAADGGEDGEEAGLFVVGRERGGLGTGGLGAKVEQVGTLVEEGEGLREGLLFAGEAAAVRERVRREIEDGHQEGTVAEGEGAAGKMPCVARTGEHGESVRGGRVAVGWVPGWDEQVFHFG